MLILLHCLRESAAISYPVQDWTKHYRTVFKTIEMVHEVCILTHLNEGTRISENYVIEGGEKEKICGDDPVKTQKCEIVYPV